MRKVRIAITAPAVRLEPAFAERLQDIAAKAYPQGTVELTFHPQCFLSRGHFAGDDAARAGAFIDMANDPAFDAIWIARGGYGSCRIAETVIGKLGPAAKRKTYVGYSDAGFLLAGLYRNGFKHVAHGPMPADVRREGGEKAMTRVLGYLVDRDADGVEKTVSSSTPSAAFNITILSSLLATPLEPDLSGHVLMLEEVSEPMYRIDRCLFHITSNPRIRKVKGIRLGRCSEIVPNDPEFGQSELQVIRHWCRVSGIAYLGRADIGHDVGNKIVPFGRYAPREGG